MDSSLSESFGNFLLLQAWAQSKFLCQEDVFADDRNALPPAFVALFDQFLRAHNIDPSNGNGMQKSVRYMPLYAAFGAHERYILGTIYAKITDPRLQVQAMFAFTVNRRRDLFDVLLPYIASHGEKCLSPAGDPTAFERAYAALVQFVNNGNLLGTEKGTYLHVPRYNAEERADVKTETIHYATGREAKSDIVFKKMGVVHGIAARGIAKRHGVTGRWILDSAQSGIVLYNAKGAQRFNEFCIAQLTMPVTVRLRERGNMVKWILRRMSEFALLGGEVYDYMMRSEGADVMDICRFISEKNKERALYIGECLEKIFVVSLNYRFPTRKLVSNECQVGSTNPAQALRMLFPTHNGWSMKFAGANVLRDKLMPWLRTSDLLKRVAKLSHGTALRFALNSNISQLHDVLAASNPEQLDASDVQVNLCEWRKFMRSVPLKKRPKRRLSYQRPIARRSIGLVAPSRTNIESSPSRTYIESAPLCGTNTNLAPDDWIYPIGSGKRPRLENIQLIDLDSPVHIASVSHDFMPRSAPQSPNRVYDTSSEHADFRPRIIDLCTPLAKKHDVARGSSSEDCVPMSQVSLGSAVTDDNSLSSEIRCVSSTHTRVQPSYVPDTCS